MSEQFPKTRPNYLYVILSVALVLLLLGIFGLAVIQTQQLASYFKEQVNILIELENDTDEAQKETLTKYLRNTRYLKDSTITFISKEEGAKLLSEEFGEDFLDMDMPNPLYDIFSFNVKANYLNRDSLTEARRSIKGFPFVNDVYYQETFVNEIARNLQQVGFIALGISLIFVIIAVTLIHNTIRLALYANRFIIKNMQLVGASWSFISRPYLVRSGWHGLLSALIAIAILTLLLLFLTNEISQISILDYGWKVGLLFIGLIVLGMLINIVSTYYVVNKYLQMRVDDLY